MRIAVRELAMVGLAAVCAVGIGLLQPGLAATLKKVKLQDDTVALPPPDQLRAMTFGYRSAVADILWASLLVQHGVHTQERRPYRGLQRYLDGILALEPNHPTLYRFVDTLIIYKPAEMATEADVRLARAYLERGTREAPFDPNRWLNYGQFIAFLAPSYMKDEAEIQRWRTDGALAMARAIELGADPDRSITVSTLLSKAGETRAAIQQLQNAYALSDNPETRQQLLLKLAKLNGNLEVETTVSKVEHEWRSRYPFLSREGALLVGPHRSPAACAGPDSLKLKECPDNWSRLAPERP